MWRWQADDIKFSNRSAGRCAFRIYGSRMCPSNVPQNKRRTRKWCFAQVDVFAHKTSHEGRNWKQIKRMWEPEEESVREITVLDPLNAILLWKYKNILVLHERRTNKKQNRNLSNELLSHAENLFVLPKTFSVHLDGVESWVRRRFYGNKCWFIELVLMITY